MASAATRTVTEYGWSCHGDASASSTVPAWLGVLAGTFTGVMLGLLFGFLTIRLRADQTLVGLGITIAGGGFTAFLYRDLLHGANPSAHVDPLFVRIPLLKDVPIVGNATRSSSHAARA